MDTFLNDFDAGRRQGRYLVAELPALPFGNATFRLAVCSHLLFLYSEQLSEDFHVSAIAEMTRVADDVRIFPLMALGGARSSHVAAVTERLRQTGAVVSIEKVDYEFQRGGNEMMHVRTNHEDRRAGGPEGSLNSSSPCGTACGRRYGPPAPPAPSP